jgi:drug/metabolite transporter (DMT)-like permease
MTLLSWPKADAQGVNTFAAVPPVPLLGEGLTVLASILFTGQIIAVDHFGSRADPARLTLVVLATTSLLSFGGAVAMDSGGMLQPRAWAGVFNDGTIWWSVGTLVVFSSVAAIHLMNTWQPLVSPATASVIYCTEPVFGTMFSVMLGTERLTLMTMAGGVAVMGSVVIVARYSGARPADVPTTG